MQRHGSELYSIARAILDVWLDREVAGVGWLGGSWAVGAAWLLLEMENGELDGEKNRGRVTTV